MRRLQKGIALIVFAGGATGTWAMDFTWNGFATVAGGKIVSSEKDNPEYLDYECPCFITDYNNAGLYEQGGFDLKPETRGGLQGTVTITKNLKAVGQVVGRSVDSDVTLEWAYLSYKVSPHWTVQVGRKRIPLYYYSDFQDVGKAYIWVRPPQALYGWEASNFNGLSVRYNGRISRWAISSSVFAGEEEVKDSGYALIYDTVDQDAKWKNIRGFDVEVSKDWLTARFVYMQSDNYGTSNPDDSNYGDVTQQKVYGLALNADFDEWFVLSEFNVNQRRSKADDYKVNAPAIMIGTGKRIGDFTPFVSYSRYWDNTSNIDSYEPERFEDWSATLRYDINPSMDIKVQFNDYKDKSYYDFVGHTKLLSIAYNIVF
jgi:hypothetical protein